MTQISVESPEQAGGTVAKIILKNFMCHSHLEVNLNRNINFISGKNGSGKSAILIALVIGLGGKSGDTNRGNNLKVFIKNGQCKAIIEITLNNVGPNAYRLEEFGNEITVVRTITPASGAYKLISANGKVVKCRKNELDDMLKQFKIQIDNPICVLNQEMAKSFIKTSNPKDLYSFYMRSTQLDQLDETIDHSLNVTIPAVEKDIANKKDELEYVNKDLEEMRRKHEKRKQLVTLEKQLEQLNAEYNWSSFHNAERELVKHKKNLTDIQSNIDNINKNIQNKDGTQKELLAKREELSQELKEWSIKKKEHIKKKLESESDLTAANNKYKSLKNEEKNLQRKIHNHKSDLVKINERLTILNNKNVEAAQRRHVAEAKRKSLEQRVDNLQKTRTVIENDKRNLVINHQKKTDEISTHMSNLRQLENNIYKVKERIKNLENNSSELSCFADYMPRLVMDIERAHSQNRFERKPIGPLGRFIKLKEDCSQVKCSSFGPAIEAILGKNLLCGFTVHSMKDAHTLKAMFQRLNIRDVPQIIISKFIDEVHDVAGQMVRHPGYISMLEALDISHPVVANTLIDQREVELILLLPSSENAYELMEHADYVPVNCSRAVTTDSVFYPAPHYRSYHLTSSKTTSILQADKNSIIRNMKESMNKLSEEVSEKFASVELMKNDEVTMKEQIRAINQESHKINKELVLAETELMKTETDDVASTEEAVLKDDVIFKKALIEKEESSLKNLNSAVESAEKDYENAKGAKANVESENCNYEVEIDRIQEVMSEVEQKYNEFTHNFEKFKSRKKDEEIMLERVKAALGKSENNVESKRTEAEKSNIHFDQESCREEGMLKEELSRVNSDINAIIDYIGTDTLEEITEELHNRIEKVDQVRSILSEASQYLTLMLRNTEERKRKFLALLTEKSTKVKENFSAITRLRNYKEMAVFDHKSRKLNLAVKTDVKKQELTNILSLSGGERSYSMVAFILALWKEMGLPFYFLDEFDVFMDPLNRHIVIKLLMMHARENQGQQFVFFTPNDFQIGDSSDVGIFRMEDPRDDSLTQL